MQSVIADPIIYDKVSKEEFRENPFLDRQMLYIQDSNNQNYSTNQVVFETQALSSSGKWLDYSESYLSFPVYMSASLSNDVLQFDDAGDLHADYLLGLKSGSHQLIHSVNLEYNGGNVLQPNGFVNMLTNYNMVTSFSQEDIKKLNASIFFNPPTESDGWVWSPAVRTSFGVGLCDNNNFPQTVGPTLGETAARCYRGNKGFLETQKAMAGSFAVPTNALNLNAGTSSNDLVGFMADDIQRNQYVNKSMDNGRMHVKRVFASIRLKDLHDFFGKLPLLRMANMRLVLNINNSTFQVTKTASAQAFNPSLLAADGPVMSLSAPVTLANGTNPLMIASCFGASALSSSAGACIPTVGADVVITCSVSVGRILNQTHIGFGATAETVSCRWYVPSYTMTPQYVSKYLSMGTKKVEFEDFLCIQVPCPTTGVTQLLTPSLKNVVKVIVIPHIATASFITAGTNCAQVASPFCDNFTAPLIGGGLSQLNIRLGGVDVIASGGHRYPWEYYRGQMACGINAGLTDGFSSGLINEYNWSKGQFQYYTVDCSRRLLEQENVPQSVELTTNNVSRYPLLLYCFVIFKREVVIDIATSAIVA